MGRVLYGVSPIGLGHATRSSAVAQVLKERGTEVVFATGGNALEHLRRKGFEVRPASFVPVPTVSDGVMKRTSLWYLRYWRGYRRSRAAMDLLVDELRPDAIVGDEEFSIISVAMEKGIKHALVTDEEELGFARSRLARAVESRVSRWYSSLLESASTVVIPDDGVDSGNRRHVGPIVRRVSRGGREARASFGLPERGPMLLLSMSGSGVGGHLLRLTVEAFKGLRAPDAFLVITGNRGQRVESDSVFDLGVVLENQDLVASADLVVSTAGKSTIDEAASAGTPIIAIPIKNHAEQERNGAQLGYVAEDVHRLAEIVPRKLGVRSEPRNFRGAEIAASIVGALI